MQIGFRGVCHNDDAGQRQIIRQDQTAFFLQRAGAAAFPECLVLAQAGIIGKKCRQMMVTPMPDPDFGGTACIGNEPGGQTAEKPGGCLRGDEPGQTAKG